MYQVLSDFSMGLMGEAYDRDSRNRKVYSKKIAEWSEEIEQLVGEIFENLPQKYKERIIELKLEKNRLEAMAKKAGLERSDFENGDKLLSKKRSLSVLSWFD